MPRNLQTLNAVILIAVTMVQLTAAFYIGSRSLGLLLADGPLAMSYLQGVVVLAVITATYTIFGGPRPRALAPPLSHERGFGVSSGSAPNHGTGCPPGTIAASKEHMPVERPSLETRPRAARTKTPMGGL